MGSKTKKKKTKTPKKTDDEQLEELVVRGCHVVCFSVPQCTLSCIDTFHRNNMARSLRNRLSSLSLGSKDFKTPARLWPISLEM